MHGIYNVDCSCLQVIYSLAKVIILNGRQKRQLEAAARPLQPSRPQAKPSQTANDQLEQQDSW